MLGYPCPRTLNIGNQQLTPNQSLQPTAGRSQKNRIRASVLDIARAFQAVHIKVGC
jgi:hypothetical protein